MPELSSNNEIDNKAKINYLEHYASKSTACQISWNNRARIIHVFQSQPLKWFLPLLNCNIFSKKCFANLIQCIQLLILVFSTNKRKHIQQRIYKLVPVASVHYYLPQRWTAHHIPLSESQYGSLSLSLVPHRLHGTPETENHVLS